METRQETGSPPGPPEEHPRGTLFIVGLYGLLLVLGWLAVFVFVYLPRGAVGR